MTDNMSLSKGQGSVNSLIVNRKQLEKYVDLFCKNNNDQRLALLKSIKSYRMGGKEHLLTDEERDHLKFICTSKHCEYKVLRALFGYIDYSLDEVDILQPEIWPGLTSLIKSSHQKRTQTTDGRKFLKQKNILDWDNQYGESKNPDRQKDSKSNDYRFLPALIALGRFTEYSFKTRLSEEDRIEINNLIIILKKAPNKDQTPHQKFGAIGSSRSIKKISQLKELEEITLGLQGKFIPSQKEYITRLQALIIEMKKKKPKKERFEISINPKIRTRKKDKPTKVIGINSRALTGRKAVPGVRKSDPGVRKSDPGGPENGPKITNSKSPEEITKYNKTTTTAKSKQRVVGNSQESSNFPSAHFKEEEFKKIFDLYFSLFRKRVSKREIQRFKKDVEDIRPTVEEVVNSIKILASDNYKINGP